MPGTETHDILSLALGGIQFFAGLSLGRVELLLSGLGSALGLLLSPDLDWDGFYVRNTKTGGRYVVANRKLGSTELRLRPIYGKVCRRWPQPLRFWWVIYAHLTKHRGFSHHWLYGTLGRLLWLVFPFPVAFFRSEFLWVWAGLWAADILHVLADRWL